MTKLRVRRARRKPRKRKCACGSEACPICAARESARHYRDLHHRATPAAIRAHYDLIRAIELRLYGPSLPGSSLDPRNLPD